MTKLLIQQIKNGVLDKFNQLLNYKVTVNFENVGKKVINAENIELKKINDKKNIKKSHESLIDTFLNAGEISLN